MIESSNISLITLREPQVVECGGKAYCQWAHEGDAEVTYYSMQDGSPSVIVGRVHLHIEERHFFSAIGVVPQRTVFVP